MPSHGSCVFFCVCVGARAHQARVHMVVTVNWRSCQLTLRKIHASASLAGDHACIFSRQRLFIMHTRIALTSMERARGKQASCYTVYSGCCYHTARTLCLHTRAEQIQCIATLGRRALLLRRLLSLFLDRSRRNHRKQADKLERCFGMANARMGKKY